MYSYNTIAVNSKLLTTGTVPDTSPDISTIFYSDGTGVSSGPGLYLLPAGTLTPLPVATGAGSGTVTNVGLSMPSIFSVSGTPVTVSGTLTASLVSQTANRVFASPDGLSGIPSFRAIVLSDIPTIPNSKLQNSSISAIANSSGADISISPTVNLGGTLTLSIPDAGALSRGVVTTGTQTFSGQKTFATAPIFSSIPSGRVLFSGASSTITGSTNFHWDNVNSRLGIGTTTPSSNLHVLGSMRLTGSLTDGANSVGTAGQVLTSTGVSTQWANTVSANIYNTNGTLTGARTFGGGGFDMTMSGFNILSISSNLDTVIKGFWYFSENSILNDSTGSILISKTDNQPGVSGFAIRSENNGSGGAILEISAKTSVSIQNFGNGGWIFTDSNNLVNDVFTNTVNISRSGNSASATNLQISAQNVGAGGANLVLSAKGQITSASSHAFNSTIRDISNSVGTAGQVLASTGTGVSWTTIPFAGDGVSGLVSTLPQVFDGVKTFLYVIKTPAVIATDPKFVYVAAQPTNLLAGAMFNVWMSHSTNLISSGSRNVYLGSTITTIPTANDCVAVGHNTNVAGAGHSRTAVGAGAQATGATTSSFGFGAVASSLNALAVGVNSSATVNGAIAIGTSAACSVVGGAQIGQSTALGTATLKFRTQIVTDETWIGQGLTGCSIDNSGSMIRTPSDMRLKRDIEDLSVVDSINLIRGVTPKTFRWIDIMQSRFGRDPRAGLIAQDVEKVLPQMVYDGAYCEKDEKMLLEIEESEDDEEIKKNRRLEAVNKFKGIKEGELIFHMFNVIKNLLSRIEVLESKM